MNCNSRNVCLLVLMLFISQLPGQILPVPNSTVSFVGVYFEVPFVNGASAYQLRLYTDSSKQNKIAEKVSALPAFNIDDLSWGNTYWWEVQGYGNKTDTSCCNLNKFSTRKKISSMNLVDSKISVRINKNDKHAGGLIMLDYARAIFDRNGRQVWLIPDPPGESYDKRQVRDLKVTADNTVTFLAGNIPVETDFEGNILWKAPSPLMIGADTITYHHDFRKGSNGHYYVLGNKKVSRKVLGKYPAALIESEYNMYFKNDTVYKRTLHGLVLEFDAAGKLVWYWDSNDYVSDEDLNFKKRENGLPMMSTHMNAFSVNKENTKIYVGFRDLHRVVRINKATKKVENSYGEKYPSGEARSGNNFFRGQHDASVTEHGSILVFDNNNEQKGEPGLSSVLEISDPPAGKASELLWQFRMDFDSLTNGKSSAAGNINELPNGNLLVCGGGVPRVFEIDKKKEIVWDALLYSKTALDTVWTAFPQYRAAWTPQLYHYHFLAEAVSSPLSELTIYNTGNTTDKYEITAYNGSGKIVMHKTSNEITAGKYLTYKLPKNKNEGGAAIKIEIRSVKNPALKKTVKIG